MSPLKILYVGTQSGTCLDRANAYRRMGHEVFHVDLRTLLPKSVWIDRITWRIGGHVFAPYLVGAFRQVINGRKFDLCHVDNGEWMSPLVVRTARESAPIVINYNIDDPTGGRDMQRFEAYRRALPQYDLVAVVREENVREAYALGARRVLRVWRSADEVTHSPRPITNDIASKWDSQVLFLGTWMPGRDNFMLELTRRGVPVSIRGDHWQKAPEWMELKRHWIGSSVHGDDYAYALQCAKVNIGLLSKGNRDLHTTRSLEIPSLGALLCAERTSEHLGMYEEGREALFWRDAEECAALCHQMLENEALRTSIAQAGHKRFLRNRHGNQDVLARILDEVGK